MSAQSGFWCAICGQGTEPRASAYILTEQSNPHRISILRWNQTLSARENVRTACSPEHALEIVAHWMVSGRLDLTFSGTAANSGEFAPKSLPLAARRAEDVHPIGELVINRESVRRLVASDPEALTSVLDSLLEVLLRDRDIPLAKKATASNTSIRRATVA